MKNIILIIIIIILFSACSTVPGLKEETKDLLGFYKTSIAYETVINAGGKVINLHDEGTFFVIWIPDNYKSMPVKRVMVAVHGTVDPEGPKGYAEEKDEIPWAREYGYAVVGINWWINKETDFLSAEKVYSIIETALMFMKDNYQSDITKCGLIGFSRGSELSYELTFIDRNSGNNFFALTICHSGHHLFSKPTPFVKRLFNGDYGDNAFEGKHFFLYCGMKDEEWQETQCESMEVSGSYLEQYGAVIDGYIADPEGRHFGFRENRDINRQAIEIFMRLTEG